MLQELVKQWGRVWTRVTKTRVFQTKVYVWSGKRGNIWCIKMLECNFCCYFLLRYQTWHEVFLEDVLNCIFSDISTLQIIKSIYFQYFWKSAADLFDTQGSAPAGLALGLALNQETSGFHSKCWIEGNLRFCTVCISDNDTQRCVCTAEKLFR